MGNCVLQFGVVVRVMRIASWDGGQTTFDRRDLPT